MSEKKPRPWQDLITRCFGENDRIFANHPLDEKRAKEAIAAAKEAGATMTDFEKELLWDVYRHVKNHDVFWELVDNQNEKAKENVGEKMSRLPSGVADKS
jgi:hypothetical protein